MRIAVNRGFGEVRGSQIRIRGAGRRSILIRSQEAPGLWLDSLRETCRMPPALSCSLSRPGCLVYAKQTSHEVR